MNRLVMAMVVVFAVTACSKSKKDGANGSAAMVGSAEATAPAPAAEPVAAPTPTEAPPAAPTEAPPAAPTEAPPAAPTEAPATAPATPAAAAQKKDVAPVAKKKAAPAGDAPCPGPGLTRRCGGVCVNLQTDDNNCGSCGAACSGGKHCDGHMSCRDADGNL